MSPARLLRSLTLLLLAPIAGCVDDFPTVVPVDPSADRALFDDGLQDTGPRPDDGVQQDEGVPPLDAALDAQPADAAPADMRADAADATPALDMSADMAAPDMATLDMAPDMATLDMAPDMAAPDMATLDMAPDMAVDAAPDMAVDAAPDMAVDAAPDLGCVPIEEICNGLDDDCDGQTDEVPPVGEICVAGVGACQAMGVRICDPETGDVICNALAGGGGMERCNNVDDDCDGRADEGFDLGAPCQVGQGACLNLGERICGPDGAAACNVEPLPANDERCDGLDNDCDGQADEGFALGAACEAGDGACRAEGVNICAANGDVVCHAEQGAPVQERCDAVDNDCDGQTDEDFRLGADCTSGVGICARPGAIICSADGAAICDAQPGEPAREACDGLDNDCDGRADEGGACSGDVARSCRVWLGWVDVFTHFGNPDRVQPFNTIGDCPESSEDQGFIQRCNSTRNTPNFRSVSLDGDMNNDDLLAVRFSCDGDSAIGAWAQDHCEVFMAYSDVVDRGNVQGEAVLESLDPESCGPSYGPVSSARPEPGCVRTGHDTDFHPIATVGTVNNDDAWGIAFRCDDPAQPDRAAGVQANVLVRLAAQHRGFNGARCGVGRLDNVVDWRRRDDTACPLLGHDSEGHETCASSSGDGQFHAFMTNHGTVGRCWAFGVALQARPVIQNEGEAP